MQPVSLRQIAVLNAVMRTATLTEAAAFLQTSQPAVSKALKDIEKRLDMKLFKRLGGRLYPTPEVQVLYKTIEGIFSNVNYLSRQAIELRDGAIGHLVVAALPAFAASLVAETVGRLHASRPGIRIEVRELTNKELVEQLRNQQVDLGITHAPLDDLNVRSRILTEDEIMCILPKEHRLADLAVITPRELASETLISYPRGSLVHALLVNAFAQDKIDFEPTAEVGNALTAYALAKTLRGVAIVDPYLFVAETFPALIARPFRPEISIAPRVLSLRGVQPSRIAAIFIEDLRKVAVESSAKIKAGTARD